MLLVSLIESSQQLIKYFFTDKITYFWFLEMIKQFKFLVNDKALIIILNITGAVLEIN